MCVQRGDWEGGQSSQDQHRTGLFCPSAPSFIPSISIGYVSLPHTPTHAHTQTHSVTVFNTYTPSWLLMHFLQNRSFFSLWKKTVFCTIIFKNKSFEWMRLNRSENPKPRRSLHQPWPHIISPNQHQIYFDKVRRKSTGVEDTLDVSLPAPQDTHTHTHHLLWPWVLNFTRGVPDGVSQMYTNIDGLITLDLKYQLKMPKSRGHSTTNWQELGVMEGLFTWDVESLDAMTENSPQQWKL